MLPLTPETNSRPEGLETKANSGSNEPPRYQRYLCLRPLETTLRLADGAVVEVLKLPSGAVLVRLVGEATAVIDEATLLACFEEV